MKAMKFVICENWSKSNSKNFVNTEWSRSARAVLLISLRLDACSVDPHGHVTDGKTNCNDRKFLVGLFVI